MGLTLVIHRPEGAGPAAEMRAALRDAVWEVAEAHWALGEDALLVSSGVSADYLLDHFRRALRRRGFADPGLLLLAPFGQGAVWAGLPPEAEAWLRDSLG